MAVVEISRPRDGVTLVTLNRPESLNAMNHELVSAVHDVLDDVDNDQSCRVMVLTGAGRAFCAGLDLKGPGAAPNTDGVGRAAAGMLSQQHIATLYTHMRRVRKPIIAAVNGAAAGGGFAFALASDIRVCSESAKFNVAFVKIGLSGCDVGVSYLLPRLIGASNASYSRTRPSGSAWSRASCRTGRSWTPLSRSPTRSSATRRSASG
jgi:enoyl-CoA hydratase